MSGKEEQRLAVENLRTKIELLEDERRVLLRELAYRRAVLLALRAELQRARDEARRNLDEPVDEN